MGNRFKELFFPAKGIASRQYHLYKGKKLGNRTPTIITNNCIAGIIYHDLGLRFFSPTINLYMRSEDFLLFLENFDAFLNAPVVEITEESVNFPIGIIRLADTKSIRLYFMHYHSFEEARGKWEERKMRINKDNLYVIFEYPALSETREEIEKTIRRFEAVPFRHKVMLTSEKGANSEYSVVLDVFNDSFYPGKLLGHKSTLSLKRNLDDFNYIQYLNDIS